MGILVNGQWRDEDLPAETGARGEFQRIESRFRERITADGSSGFKAEAARYHLYVAYSCPWAHRTLIFRALKKLERAISVAYAIPGERGQGWAFESNPAFPDCTPDAVNGFRHLHQAYTASDAGYTGKVTVPTLWDTKTKRVINNESSEIIRMLNSEFRGIAGDDTDFYPPPLRAEIDRVNEFVYARTSTTASIAAASPARRRPTTQPTTRCSRRSTSSRPDSGGSAISSATASPRPIGACSRRSCASTSRISRCSSATGSASPIFRISRTTCASSTRSPASPPR